MSDPVQSAPIRIAMPKGYVKSSAPTPVPTTPPVPPSTTQVTTQVAAAQTPSTPDNSGGIRIKYNHLLNGTQPQAGGGGGGGTTPSKAGNETVGIRRPPKAGAEPAAKGEVFGPTLERKEIPKEEKKDEKSVDEEKKKRTPPKPQYVKTAEDEAYAALAETKEPVMGVRVDPSFYKGELPKQWWKDNYLVYEETADRQWGVAFNPQVVFTLQRHFDLPKLELAYGTKRFPLHSSGGRGLFYNPVTGKPAFVTQQFPKRGNFTRLSGELATETVVRTPYGIFLVYFEPYYITEDKKSGQLEYYVKDFGSRFLPGSGQIQGFAKVENKTDPSRWDYNLYARWAHDLEILKSEWGVALYFERKSGESDANRETLLEAWGKELGFMLVQKNIGLFVQAGLLKDSTKLYWDNGWHVRVGFSFPFKTIFHMLGMDALGNALADAFELNEEGFPIATTHTLLGPDCSKVTLFGEYVSMKEPRSPIIGEFKPGNFFRAGTYGPGGPGGKFVKGSSIGGGFTYNIRFKEDPFPDSPFWNTALSRTSFEGSILASKYKISGNDHNMRTELSSRGGFGSVFVSTPHELQPSPEGWWWSVSGQVSRDFPLEVNDSKYGFLTIGLYADVRKVLGQVTDNEISDKPIKTVGVVVSYKYKPRPLRTAAAR